MLRKTWLLIKDAAIAWKNDNSMILSAALSFFTVFSIVPILILTIAIAGRFFGPEQTQQEIIRQIEIQFNPQAAQSVRSLVTAAQKSGAGLASMFSGVLFIFLASRIFNQLQKALNIIWKVDGRRPRGLVMSILRQRLISFGMVVIIGLAVLSFFFVDAFLQTLSSSIGSAFSIPFGLPAWKILSFVSSLGVFTVLFAVVYKILPEAKISWKDVWVGALVTSVLFAFARLFLSLYFRVSDVASLYGAAGSIVILLLGVYFTMQIFLFGAEFTWVYANRYGSRADDPPKKDHKKSRE